MSAPRETTPLSVIRPWALEPSDVADALGTDREGGLSVAEARAVHARSGRQPKRPSSRQGAMKNLRPVRLLVTTLSLVLAACTAASSGPSLDGREFLSTSVTEGGAERPLERGTGISLRFDDGQLSASAGCNIMGGAYRIADGTLLSDAMSTTEMGCDPGRHAQDEWLSEFLGSRPTVELAGNDLVLSGGMTVIRLLDREVARPDLPLIGTLWTIDSLVSGDVVSSVPTGTTATLEFTTDGQVRVDTGCNTGGGAVVVDQAAMHVSELVLTKRLCEPPASQVEAAVLAVLAGDITYGIDAGTLTLRADGGGLLLRGS